MTNQRDIYGGGDDDSQMGNGGSVFAFCALLDYYQVTKQRLQLTNQQQQRGEELHIKGWLLVFLDDLGLPPYAAAYRELSSQQQSDTDTNVSHLLLLTHTTPLLSLLLLVYRLPGRLLV